MLVVVAIIGLLIAALLPAFGAVRIKAKYAAAGSMFNALDQGIALFRAEQALGGGLPPSVSDNSARDRTAQRHKIRNPNKLKTGGDDEIMVQGAHLLAQALIGADGLGVAGFRDLDRDGTWWNDTHDDACETNNRGGLYGLSATGEPCHPRYGGAAGYVDEKMRENMKSVQQLADAGVVLNPPPAEEIAPNELMFIDPFDTPVLYYRANRSASRVVGKAATPGIYWQEDNGMITGSAEGLYEADGLDFGAGKVDGVYHDLRDTWSPDPTLKPDDILNDPKYPQSFFHAIWDPSIKARPSPVRPDSYLLISAGNDRRYGTDDDVSNWTREKTE